MKNPHRALEAIECLVGGDFALELEAFLYEDKRKDKRLVRAAEIITTIYQISHSENSHSCKHENWENIKYKIIKDNKEI